MNKSNTYCVIMAGGVGSRFWPMSTSKLPKQFHDVLGTGRTLIQQTYDRLLKVTTSDKIYVVTDKVYQELVSEQLPEMSNDQIIIEPVGMNTAPCVLYSSMKIEKFDKNANLIFCPSDHIILQQEKFVQKVKVALDNLQTIDGLYTLGIKPTRPDTGFGYIQYIESDDEVKKVKTFTEKPNLQLAKNFISSGDFLWNSGMFIWKANTIINAFRLHLPEMYSSLNEIKKDFGTKDEQSSIAKVYPTLQRVSIDIGILEKFDGVYVIPASFGWSDLGTWSSLYDNFEKDENKNALQSGSIIKMYSSKGNVVNIKDKEKVVVIDGLDDYIVVDTDEALLICPMSNDQEIKKYVNDLRLTKGGDKVV